MRLAKIDGHTFTYSPPDRLWLMVQCGCPESAQVCKFARKIEVGQLGPRVGYVMVRKAREPYWEQLIEHALMQEEGR